MPWAEAAAKEQFNTSGEAVLPTLLDFPQTYCFLYSFLLLLVLGIRALGVKVGLELVN